MATFEARGWLALLFGVAVSAHANPADDARARFSESSKETAEGIRSSPDYIHPRCDLDAVFVGNEIIRVGDSGQSALKADDVVLAVDGKQADAKDSSGLLALLRTHAVDDRITLDVKRRNAELKVRATCRNSATRVLARLAALDAAAAGDFRTCALLLRDANLHLLIPSNYSQLTSCESFSGELSAEDVAVRTVQFWALVFQDVKHYPDRIQSLRPRALGDITKLEQTGQTRLANELDSMLAAASGRPLPKLSNAPPPAAVPVAPSRPTPENRPLHTYRAPRTSKGQCESGHWIDSVSDDGDIIKLDDGSIWEVNAVDTISSALWLPTTDIVVCDDKLINTEDNEQVEATRLR